MKKQIYRARFSSVTAPDIRKAMNNLVDPNLSQSLAVDARQEIDLRAGVAFSRFQTQYFVNKYANLNTPLLSYGPCQIPTLGIAVARYDTIQRFQPEKHWTLDVSIRLSDSTDKSFKLGVKWSRKRLFSRIATETFESYCRRIGFLVLDSVARKKSRRTRPTPLNTLAMLRIASKALHMSPDYCMHVAERLYISGYISYPRTESTAYPKSFDFRSVLSNHSNHPDWGHFAQNLLSTGYTKPRKGIDHGDHPPITPLRSAVRNSLAGDEWRLYNYIVRHFLGTISPDAVINETTLHFTCGDEKFRSFFASIDSPGYFEIMPWLASSATSTLRLEQEEDGVFGQEEEDDFFNQEILLDEWDGRSYSGTATSRIESQRRIESLLQKGASFSISQIKIVEGKTSPPPLLSESELLAQMDKYGIGTDASMATHIKNIVNRNYVSINPQSRRVIPTELGIALVRGYLSIDPDLVVPKLRSEMEKYINLIAQGQADFLHVVHHTLRIFEQKFRFFVSHIYAMDKLFEAKFSTLANSVGAKPFVVCGNCRNYTIIIRSKPTRLYCRTCELTFDLPQKGKLTIYKGLTCPIDGFGIVYYSLGRKGHSYPLCPQCWNSPPQFDVDTADLDDLDNEGDDHIKPNESNSTQSSSQTESVDSKSAVQTMSESGESAPPSTSQSEGQSLEADESYLAHMTCMQCLHKSCQWSRISKGVGKCPSCESGQLYFDLQSKPVWKVNCDSCSLLVYLPESAPSVKLHKDQFCPSCSRSVFSIQLHKNFALPGISQLDHICIICDESKAGGFVQQAKSVYLHPNKIKKRFRRGGKRGKSRRRKRR